MKRLWKCIGCLLLSVLVCVPCIVYAGEETATTETIAESDGSMSLAVDKDTVYVEVQGTWSTIEGSITFDSSCKVKDHGATAGLKAAAAKQLKIGFPVENLMEEEYVFVGVYTSLDGEGITYTGPAFSLSFEDITTPFTVQLKDSSGNVIDTATVDGTTSQGVDEAYKVSFLDILYGKGIVILVIAVIIALVVVSVLCFRLRKKRKKVEKESI